MKNKFLSLFSALLILLGITLFFLPQLSSQIIDKRTEENVVVVEEVPAETLQENLTSESTFDFDSILEVSPSQTFLGTKEVDKNLLVGRLFIPSIDLNLAVYNGITNTILHAGAGTMRPNLEMGKGNFPIAGHYASNKKTLFGDLTSIAIGETVYLTDNDLLYEYIVYDTKIVEPTEIEWIQDDIAEKHGKPIISLMNCYYVDGKNTDKRYFVFAELVDSYPTDEI